MRNDFQTIENLSVLKALVLARCGARREMAAAIKAGRVTINGITVDSFTQPIDVTGDHLTLDGKAVATPAPKLVYIVLNKPLGVLSATKDHRGRRTIMDLLPSHLRYPDLHPVGRLDMDSCGLVVITNDGDLTYYLTHPRFQREKEYAVMLDRPLSHTDKERFEAGIMLSDGLTSPLTICLNGVHPAGCNVTLHEGRKRQLRRMFVAVGYRVIELKRIREGQLLLGDLPVGQSRLLTAQEVADLRANATDNPEMLL